MKTRVNRRGSDYHVVESRHVKLEDLKQEARHLENQYLSNELVPDYPRPEVHVSHLKHDTDSTGLRGIKRDGGFKDPHGGSLVWWSLFVGPDEVTSAEWRLLETTYPDRTEEQAQEQHSFLWRFATSPAFMEASMLGSYRFTLPLEEVLRAYSKQFCCGAQPVMKVFKTFLFKQEVMYAVLVHSPANEELFSDRPALTDDPDSVCTFKDGRFIWRPEAMCSTHNVRLVHRPNVKQLAAEEASPRLRFYVWDHVGVALHVDSRVLNFDTDRLRKSLTFCSRAAASLPPHNQFDDFPQAKLLVHQLWPEFPTTQERPERLEDEVAAKSSSH